MPVTRSGSNLMSRALRSNDRGPLKPQPPNIRSTPPRSGSTPADDDVIVICSDDDDDVIVISSDDDDEPRRPQPSTRRKVPVKGKAKAHPPELTDLSERDQPATSSTNDPAVLRKQIEALKKSKSGLEVQLTMAKGELRKQHSDAAKGKADAAQAQKRAADLEQKLKSMTKEGSGALVKDLDDNLCCEICTLKMWTPYNLPCGHTFCQTCLTDWFSTTLTQHMAANPHYNPRDQPPASIPILPQALRNDEHRLRTYVHLSAQQRRSLDQNTQNQLTQYEQYVAQRNRCLTVLTSGIQGPAYTCPACRADVKHKPAEVFALKSVVHAISEAAGDVIPAKAPGANGLWDGFFAS